MSLLLCLFRKELWVKCEKKCNQKKRSVTFQVKSYRKDWNNGVTNKFVILNFTQLLLVPIVMANLVAPQNSEPLRYSAP
jgi:hypothetical protein